MLLGSPGETPRTSCGCSLDLTSHSHLGAFAQLVSCQEPPFSSVSSLYASLLPFLAPTNTYSILICSFSAPHPRFHQGSPPGPGPATAASPASSLGLAYGRHSVDAEDGEDNGPRFTGGETEAQRDGLRSDREWRLAQAKVFPPAPGAVGSWDSWWGPSQWPEGWCVWQQLLGLLWGPTPTLHAGRRGREGGAAAAGGWLGASSILGWEGPHAGVVSLSLCLFHSLCLGVSLFLSLFFSF